MAVRQNGLFNLAPLRARMPTPLGALIQRPLEQMLALPGINDVYENAVANPATEFCQSCLEYLDVAVKVRQDDLKRIPPTGPVVVVANHPFGGIEGLILASVMLKVRPDFKVLVNHMLGRIPEMRPICVYVDPFGTDARQNIRGLKEALGLLRGGGCLGVFPAGEVSHFRFKSRRVEDPKWSTHIGGLIRRTGATVIPVFFEGANGPMFQAAGMIHPRLRTALLGREVMNKRHKTCRVQVGRVISGREMATFKTDDAVVQFLRNRTYALSERTSGTRLDKVRAAARALGWRRGETHEAIARPLDPARLAREINACPPAATLAASGTLRVVCATAAQVPLMMQELGRLREVTFRAVGEGTGRSVDLDAFDQTYRHLLVWNDATRELVGAYRLGLSDELTAARGPAGLYVHTLFDFDAELLRRLGPTIELGRSFVRAEYQRSFSPLVLLWKGIGRFVSENPKYRYLMGPVSISNTYRRTSRALIIDFMSRPERRAELAGLVRPRKAFKTSRRRRARVAQLSPAVADMDDLSDLIADIESDGKGVPVLLKQYGKLGAKALGFNVDPDFGHCLDCLITLDLVTADTRAMERYMGREEVATYRAAHGRRA